jgi:circadian clock protein KaiC
MDKKASDLVPTGVTGLDEILFGGLPRHRQYLVEGMPGSGKTTLALQFLLEGRRRGEKCLYITLSETKQELEDVAASHGWTLEGIELYELEAAESRIRPEDEYTVFLPEEVELSETMREVYGLVERLSPMRTVFDSLSELRLLARDPLKYRRQILGIKQFFAGRGCTVLLLDDKSVTDGNLQLQSIAHGVISLDRLGQEYGVSRRQLRVVKLRGAHYRDGYHDYAIETGGLRVYPRLVAAEHRADHSNPVLSSSITELDALLGGGIHAGTSTLIVGPAGTGKSTFAGIYLRALAAKGLRGVAFIFEETRQTYLNRMAGLSQSLTEGIAAGRIVIQQVDPAELSPGYFLQVIREEVEQRGTRLIIIDSINGYLNAMPNEHFLTIQLHELLSYLAEKGVATLLISTQHGLIGTMKSPIDISYLADTVVLLRFFELNGSVKKAISVLKHRQSGHEETIRELKMDPTGMHIGKALTSFHGVLTGTPVYTGGEQGLLKEME